MFEDGAKLDDIMNVLKPPTLDKDDGRSASHRAFQRDVRFAVLEIQLAKTKFLHDLRVAAHLLRIKNVA